ncbi:hypothetical protein JAAARDRAFT_194979 [Jaapia argillacea MUCL 33604]|uniref:Uncharacterized protein n=1 Tax=Jaapia argillacea MUCL 33604 TaxID=933084 RepID=A0A067PNF3_9AGAM|nr:hypothetical protein JAAARDRAFT_194979 [Jaapia argillacea MUCL 33604]
MLIRSAVDPSIQSTIQLAVLRYGDESEIVALPESFDEMYDLTRQIFDLDVRLAFRFSTNDADACKGSFTKIHPTAWEGLRPLLANIVVTKVDQSSAPCASSSKTAPTNSVQPPMRQHPESDHDEFVLVAPKARASSPSSSKGKASHVVHDEDSDVPDDSKNYPADDHEDQTSTNRGTRREDDVPEATESGVIEGKDETRAQRPLGLRQTRDESRTEAAAPTPHPPHRDDPQEQNRESEEPAASQTSNVSTVPGGKITVVVTHSPTGREVFFKVRPDILVSKLLGHACKSLALDYETSNLILVTEDSDDESEEGRNRTSFVCHRTDTLARAGAQDQSKFIIKVGDDDDSDSDDDQ